jgi:hypothetical protein
MNGLLLMLDEINKICKNITNVYNYGSRVYYTHNDKSDYDIIVVNNDGKNNEEIVVDNLNIHFYSCEQFQQDLTAHKIHALECFFVEAPHILLEKHKFNFDLNLSKLRCEISAKANNSWSKCAKKLTVEHNCEYIGLKSLFHSLRIICFGIQIAKTGKIHNYAEANHYFQDIFGCGKTDWQYFKEKYQPEFNRLMTEFRKVAPKDIDNV